MKQKRKVRAAWILAAMMLLASCGGTADAPDADQALQTSDPSPAAQSGFSRKKEQSKDRGGKSTSKKQRSKATHGQTKKAGAGSDTGYSAPSGNDRESRSNDGGGTRPRAAAPVDPGTYTYDTRGERKISGGTRQKFPPATTLEVRAPQGETQYSRRDLRDEDGNGTVTETDLVYTAQGVRLARLKITSNFGSGLTDVREFRPEPPVMLAPTGAGPGDVVRFTLQGSGTTVRVTVRIRKPQTLTIGGRSVETQLVTIDAVFSGALEGKQHTLAWIDPENLLTVKEHVTTDVRNGPVEVHSEYEATLRSLDPS